MLGTRTLDALASAKVALVGLGGVGSWCAESLVRTGVGELLLVDSDRVAVTNVNRQLMATTKTEGQVKVEVLAARLREINPDVKLTVRAEAYGEANAADFGLERYDYVIDAIDSLSCKAALIRHALSLPSVTLFASMGAALKMDPTRVRVTEFWRVEGCPLARALRHRFKRLKRRPARKFLCVYSDELLENKGHNATCGTEHCMCPKAKQGPGDAALLNHEWCSSKAQINGSMMHITAIFGLTIAGLVLQDLVRE